MNAADELGTTIAELLLSPRKQAEVDLVEAIHGEALPRCLPAIQLDPYAYAEAHLRERFDGIPPDDDDEPEGWGNSIALDSSVILGPVRGRR
jgi:hypothetical protein